MWTCFRAERAVMAGKRPAKRFLVPDHDELDKPIEGIKRGSIFAGRGFNVGKEVDVKTRGEVVEDNKQGGLEERKQQTRNNHNGNEVNCPPASEKKEDERNSMNSVNVVSAEIVNDASNMEAVRKENSTVPQTASKSGTASIIVNARQRGNPVLKYIRNVPWEYGEAVPDYVLGQTSCALFLSLRYHNFNPDYIHERLKELGSRFELRVLLVLVDVKDPHRSLKELAKICILSDCTLILSWSNEEAGRYLETYKCYENKPADILQERVDGDHNSKMIDCLTSVKSVNKTDAVTLMANFGSLHGIVNASKEEISLCPGFGLQKAERLHKIFHEPFIKNYRRKEKSLMTPEKPRLDEKDKCGQVELTEEHSDHEREMDTS